MPDLFDPVRALYGEPRTDGTVPSRDDLDEAARAEMAALMPVKEALHRRPRQAPDAAVLATILEAARTAKSAPGRKAESRTAVPRATDRPSARPARRRSRVVVPILALFACGAVGLSFMLSQQPALPDDLAGAVPALTESVPATADVPPGNAAALTEREEATLAETRARETAPGRGEAEAVAAAPPVPSATATELAATEFSAAESADDVAAYAQPAAAEAAEAGAVSRARLADQQVGTSARGRAPSARTGLPAGRQPGIALVASGSASGAATAWESPSDEDLRLLSLRLQTLRESNQGLAWDEPPVALSSNPAEALRSRALDLTSDTVHDETRVGFHATPQPTGSIRVRMQVGGR